MAVRIKINAAGLNAALSQQGVRDELERVAEQVATRARASAPVQSGAYRDSIHVEIDDDWLRPRARIVADVPHATSVEASTGNLTRALGSE